MVDVFRQFWWLIFPLFGMFMAAWDMIFSERRTNNLIQLIRTYTDQGKEPPPELLRLAAKQLEDRDEGGQGDPQRNIAWSFFTFAGLAAGFGVAYYFVSRTEDWAWLFLGVAVCMSVLALGALVILFALRRK